MSNQYFRNWQASNSSKSSVSETHHLNTLKKLNDDCARLDRALDKIKTEEKAQRIFKQPQHIHIPQAAIYSGIGFVNPGSTKSHPVQLTYVGNKYVIVNGCLVLYQGYH